MSVHEGVLIDVRAWTLHSEVAFIETDRTPGMRGVFIDKVVDVDVVVSRCGGVESSSRGKLGL